MFPHKFVVIDANIEAISLFSLYYIYNLLNNTTLKQFLTCIPVRL